MEVVFYHRKPRAAGNYSIEAYFEDVRKNLPSEVKWRVAVSKYENNGFFRRIYNIFEAAFRQGDVNHITGEVHYLTFLLRKKKTILTILDCGFMNNGSKLKRMLMKFFWLYLPVKRCRLVTAISESTKQDILKYIKCDPDKIKVVYVSVSPKFKPSHKEFNSIKPNILQIGTAPNKNIERLAEALQGISCTLTVIGRLSPSQLDSLHKYKIDFINKVNLSEEELIEEYNNCDIIAFISTYEGFGMPIVEANAVGRAVITGNSSSMPEIGGSAAIIVDPYKIEDITEGITKLLNDPELRNKFEKYGFINIRRFEAYNITKQYNAIYSNIFYKN
jgi:glycosyltransferase involved in cell wall biosynthesis